VKRGRAQGEIGRGPRVRPELYFAEVSLGSAGYKFASECGIREGENPVLDPESLPITGQPSKSQAVWGCSPKWVVRFIQSCIDVQIFCGPARACAAGSLLRLDVRVILGCRSATLSPHATSSKRWGASPPWKGVGLSGPGPRERLGWCGVLRLGLSVGACVNARTAFCRTRWQCVPAAWDSPHPEADSLVVSNVPS